MSVNRENVSWERADGTWAVGFYDFFYTNQDSPDFDSEWDVEYSDSFSNVYFGNTPESAMAKYTRFNSNPGGTTLFYNTPDNTSQIAHFEALCTKWENLPETAKLPRFMR